MSWSPCPQAKPNPDCPDAVDIAIVPRTGDIGNFEVRRALPFKDRRMVGPFIFWDQMGPGEFLAGQGVDVRPHPHTGLSTVTYLFDGSIVHKDSLGNDLSIVPGDVNLMTAGAGIVHSERTHPDVRKSPSRLYGIQSWLAQPKTHEQGAPAFSHIAKQELPVFDEKGAKGRVILGDFMGLASPIATQWDTLYTDLQLQAGSTIGIPSSTEERALYVLGGVVELAGVAYQPQQMLVLCPGQKVTIKAQGTVHCMLLGGAAMDGPRYIYWNFVSSDKDCLEQAKQDWLERKFPMVPGDEHEFTPLPD